MSLTIVGVAIFHQATTAVIPWFIDGERMSYLFWRGVIPPSSRKEKNLSTHDLRKKLVQIYVCSIQDSSSYARLNRKD